MRPESTLHVIRAAGGRELQITNGKSFDDKPRWSPDGKTIYYVSDADGFFNIWKVGFDERFGKTTGPPVRITKFDSPALMIPKNISLVEMSLAKDKLIVNMNESSGGIWTLDSVNK